MIAIAVVLALPVWAFMAGLCLAILSIARLGEERFYLAWSILWPVTLPVIVLVTWVRANFKAGYWVGSLSWRWASSVDRGMASDLAAENGLPIAPE